MYLTVFVLMLIMENNVIMEIKLDAEVVLLKKIGLVVMLLDNHQFVLRILSCLNVVMVYMSHHSVNNVMMGIRITVMDAMFSVMLRLTGYALMV